MIDLVKLHQAATHAQVEGYLLKWNGSEIRQLVDQLQASQKDAARYRWLRSQPNNTDAPRIDVVHWLPEDESANCGEGLRTEDLDCAIDAAMEADRASNGEK